MLSDSPVHPDLAYQTAVGGITTAVFVEHGENECVWVSSLWKNVFVEETLVILTDGEILACEKPLQLLVDHRKLLMLH